MNRRRLLAGVAAAVGTAGCTRGRFGSPSDRATETAYPPGRADLERYEPARVVAEPTVGDPSRRPEDTEPHGVFVWNATDRDETVRVTAERQETEWQYEESFLLPADAAVEASLAEPGSYRVTVAVGGASTRYGIERDWFDCNSSVTRVGFFGDEFRSSIVSTAMLCSTATDR